MRVDFTRSAERDYRKLSDRDRRIVTAAIDTYAVGAANVNVIKLHDWHPPRWRLRAGNLRVIFDRVEDRMIVEHIFDRKDAPY